MVERMIIYGTKTTPVEYVIVDNMYKDEERVKVVKCYRRKTMPEGVILKEAKPIE